MHDDESRHFHLDFISNDDLSLPEAPTILRSHTAIDGCAHLSILPWAHTTGTDEHTSAASLEPLVYHKSQAKDGHRWQAWNHSEYFLPSVND